MTSSSVDLVFEQLQQHVAQFLLLLSQKEKFVIERRFNLDLKKRATLEQIGRHFHVTRERIRQIEKNALQKLRRNVENSPLHSINDIIFDLLSTNGGILREDILLSKFFNQTSEFSTAVISLVSSVDKRFERMPNTIMFHPYLRLNVFSESTINEITEKSLNFLHKEKEVVGIGQVFNELKSSFEAKSFTIDSLKSLLQIQKNFKLINDSSVGLYEWRNINPRTLRDKIFFILRIDKKPLHFIDIQSKIITSGFDHKNVNLQAVHNELIRCQDFVLIGRGIYALKEWGYSHGTVSDVIKTLLNKNQSLHQEEIIDEVLKVRQVKPITVLLNLKNSPEFIRVGRKQYALAKVKAN
ncbi:MAG: sigma factor-like helix-turn-helix DNA-binding protein [Candidatus Gracilibacteria bacterium]|jgi:hypothetical protein